MCAVQGWGGVCTRRGEIQPAQGEFRGGIKTANTPPWPAGVQRFDSMKRTPRVVIPPPLHRSTEKMQNGSFYHLPQQGSRRNPVKRFRWEEDERQRARVLPLAAGRGIRRPLGRQPASHLSGLRRSRCPAKRTGRGMAPHPQAAGRSPHPLKAASVSAETLLPASGGAASKGDQSPFEEPPALRGDERNHFRKVTDYEKRYQIQHAHGVR